MTPKSDVPGVEPGASVFDRVGGHDTFAAIVGAFFEDVRTDEVLGPMYAPDFVGAQERLLMFLEQYWGGPERYSRTRGAPLLRMRHMPFKVTAGARERWVGHMHEAIDSVGLPPEDASLLRDHVERAGTYLVNAD